MAYVYPGPTAITSGLIVFMWIVYFVPSMKFALNPMNILEGQYWNFFSNLSMYPLDHVDLPHLIVNSFVTFVLLPELELKKGTIRVGVLLNLYAVITGIVYTVLCLLLKLTIHSNMAIKTMEGSSGWLFTVYTWNCYRLANKPENSEKIWKFSDSIRINKLKLYPFICFILVSIIFFKNSSILGHLSGILVGLLYFHYQKFFDVTVCLPRKLLLYIETLKYWTARNYTGFNLTKFLNFLTITYAMEDEDPINQEENDIENSVNGDESDSFLPGSTVTSATTTTSSTRHGRRNTLKDMQTPPMTGIPMKSSIPDLSDLSDFAAPPSLSKNLSSHSPVRSRSRRGTLLDNQKPGYTKTKEIPTPKSKKK